MWRRALGAEDHPQNRGPVKAPHEEGPARMPGGGASGTRDMSPHQPPERKCARPAKARGLGRVREGSAAGGGPTSGIGDHVRAAGFSLKGVGATGRF